MKKQFTLLITLIAFFWQSKAQFLTEDFETGSLPAGWSLEYVTSTSDWTYDNGGHNGHPAAAHGGSYNALFHVTIIQIYQVSNTFNGFFRGQPILTFMFWHGTRKVLYHGRAPHTFLQILLPKILASGKFGTNASRNGPKRNYLDLDFLKTFLFTQPGLAGLLYRFLKLLPDPRDTGVGFKTNVMGG